MIHWLTKKDLNPTPSTVIWEPEESTLSGELSHMNHWLDKKNHKSHH